MDPQRELMTLGFKPVGAIRPDDSGRACRADVGDEIKGSVVYALVANSEIVRFGTAGRGKATLRMRMQMTASALNGVLRRAGGSHNADWADRRLDPFKRHAQAVIADNHEIQVWARECPADTCAEEERDLALKYQPPWENSADSAEPTNLSLRLTGQERHLIEEAAAHKGWKAAHFLRVSALERAAHVLNLARPSSLDFTGVAKRLAEVLVAPRTITIGDIVHRNAHEDWMDLHEDTCLSDLAERENFDPNELVLRDFKPQALTPGQVEELHTALRLGGAEFAAQLVIECRRLATTGADPNLPPPIDPHNLKD